MSLFEIAFIYLHYFINKIYFETIFAHKINHIMYVHQVHLNLGQLPTPQFISSSFNSSVSHFLFGRRALILQTTSDSSRLVSFYMCRIHNIINFYAHQIAFSTRSLIYQKIVVSRNIYTSTHKKSSQFCA